MDASKVTISQETREKLSRPLSAKNKKALKIQLIKEYIRSKPIGTKFSMQELAAAAGYDKNRGAVGWAFVNRLHKNGVIDIEGVTKYKKNVTIPKDSKATKELSISKDDKKLDTSSSLTKREDKNVSNLAFITEVEDKAREFSWKENSDSLREFIKFLK